MARTTCESSSDDEFPDLGVVARRARQKLTAKMRVQDADKENVLADDAKPKSAGTGTGNADVPTSLSKGTPLRMRKLGNTQVLGDSLFQKWSNTEQVVEEGITKTAVRSRISRVRTRVIKDESPDISETSSAGSSNNSSQRDDTSSRKKTQAPARRAGAQLQQKTSRTPDPEPLVVEEPEEHSDSGKAKQESEEESEFVTALDLETGSESSFSDSDSEPLPPFRRSRSPIGSRLKTIRLVPASDLKGKSKVPTKPLVTLRDRKDAADKPQVLQTPRKEASDDSGKPSKPGNPDDDFKRLRIYAEDMDDSPDEQPRVKPQLDPITPKKTLAPLSSKFPKIPMSPWKPEHKEFWDPEVQNGWIDQHSPAKPSRSKPVSGVEDIKANLKEKYGISPEKRDAKKAFDQIKDSLAQRFLRELDDQITSGKLAQLTASTGGVRTQWSSTLQSTAGRAHWKCKEMSTLTQLPDGSFKSVQERRHTGYIELAVKVLTNEADLLNTVAHEFCHLAVFMLDGKPKCAHGAEFKAWGRRCMDVFGKSRGIEVTTKHSYDIDYKYIWKCADCLTEVRRHSKSVDPVKQRCGRCRGILEQVKPVPRGRGGKTAYQEFVSTEMKALKAEGRALSFKEMMVEVSGRWKVQQGRAKGAASNLKVQEITREFEELAVADFASKQGCISLGRAC